MPTQRECGGNRLAWDEGLRLFPEGGTLASYLLAAVSDTRFILQNQSSSMRGSSWIRERAASATQRGPFRVTTTYSKPIRFDRERPVLRLYLGARMSDLRGKGHFGCVGGQSLLVVLAEAIHDAPDVSLGRGIVLPCFGDRLAASAASSLSGS